MGIKSVQFSFLCPNVSLIFQLVSDIPLFQIKYDMMMI